MKIEEFIESYSSEYLLTFRGEELTTEIEEKIEVAVKEKKSTLSKISSFLFDPVYEVNNLKFKMVSSS